MSDYGSTPQWALPYTRSTGRSWDSGVEAARRGTRLGAGGSGAPSGSTPPGGFEPAMWPPQAGSPSNSQPNRSVKNHRVVAGSWLPSVK